MKYNYLDELTKKLIPITELRRNAGSILNKLPVAGSFVLTKSGKPIAELVAIGKSKKAKFDDSKGAWKGTDLENFNFSSLVLKWRKLGSRKHFVKL